MTQLTEHQPDRSSADTFTALDEESAPMSEAVQRRSQYSALDRDAAAGRKFGTYLGVFRPTILTLFGVIMYIRMGWVVGNAGLLGALGVLVLTFLITGTAALALSSVATNIRLRAGGVFALVSQSLGLEAGGAIGVPLFLAQSMGAALYIYGFAEGWRYLFPHHPQWMVVGSIFLVGFTLSLISERLVLRLQLIVLLGVLVALGSMFGGFWTHPVSEPKLWGSYESGSAWLLFAVFFPAGTGIKVGASLSGKLEDPRRSIPVGTMAAWGTALCTYAALMVWYSMIASPEELTGNYLIAVEKAAWGPAVLIGLLSSCASAMLSSMVAAPNVLAALAKHRIVPWGSKIAPPRADGTPRKAALVNGAVVGGTLLLGDLNAVAQLITMFFLITYATLNLVVLIEQSLGLVSFRPTFRVPLGVPVVGAIASVFAMTITNPAFGLIALGVVVGIYIYLERKRLETPWETVRSGIFQAMADWAARQSQRIEGANERAWKPDVLAPIQKEEELRGDYKLLLDIVKPRGSIQVFCLTARPDDSAPPAIANFVQGLRAANLYATVSPVCARDLVDLTRMSARVLKNVFFRPNILFLNTDSKRQEDLQEMMAVARSAEMGIALLIVHKVARLGRERALTVWVRDQSPHWELGLRLANLDLSLLLGYQLARNWGAKLRLRTVVEDERNLEDAETFLHRIIRDARLPGGEVSVIHGTFEQALEADEDTDLNIFGLPVTLNLASMRHVSDKTRTSCLFVMDSGHESALA
jgi:amino acid transporter